MKARFITLAAMAVVAAVAISVVSFSEEKKGTTMSHDEMMAVWMKLAQPGEQHKFLESMAGSWDVVAKWWEGEGVSGESKGSAEAEMILGGRFLHENFSGEMDGQPFKGMNIVGYDNIKKEYVLFWVDEMSTSFMITKGQLDKSGKALNMSGSYPDPMNDMKETSFRTVTRIINNDQHVYEMYNAGPDGKEMKTLEVTYNRRK